MVTSSRVSLQELWLQNEQMKVDVDDSLVHLEFSGTGDNDYEQSVPSAIFSVSKHIRALIKQQAKEQKTTNRLDLSNESAMKLVPVDLYNMLSWIMSDSDDFELDNNGQVQVNESVKQKALSISQGIMSASARMNMPKNTALALHVLKQTRSKDTVIMLNRGRRKSCQTSEAFYTKKSTLTIQDRRAARSVNQALPDDDLEHAAIIYEFKDEIGVWLALKISHFDESLSSELETLPALDSFLAALETKPSKKTLIQCGPIFPESPTKPDVVKASLDYFQELSRKLGQGKTVITCDQAIYDIAKALVTKEREMYPHVILRLGGFHIAENFLKAKSAAIIDAMAFIQRHQALQSETFGDMSMNIIKRLIATYHPDCCTFHI
ncbi:hypothetical protein ElyMa_004593800, partial [Elysia marginata]